MNEQICPFCNGSGEGTYYTPGRTPEQDTEYRADCRGCRGTGFDRHPTARDFRESREALERSLHALSCAVAALNQTLGVKAS